jgi:hypothetical protein
MMAHAGRNANPAAKLFAATLSGLPVLDEFL